MKCSKLEIVVVIVILAFICDARGALTIAGPKCGIKICQFKEYCSKFDNQCHPCSDICNQSTHNYDANICVEECQDYLHDIRYVRKDGDSPGKEDLAGEVQRLHYMVTVTLTLTCFVFLALVLIVIIQVLKWKKNNNVTFASLCSKFRSKKSYPNDNKSTGNCVTGGPVNGKAELRLDMPTATSQSEHSPATLTTSISRRPAEDSALDYAYDNHAMSSSPSPNSKPPENNF